MKKIICFLMGLLLFACSNNPAVTVLEVEDDWVYGEYFTRPINAHIINDGVLRKFTKGELIYRAVVYKSNERKYLQIVGEKIPPLEFKNGRVEYQDSLVKFIVEKNGDKFYVEFTAPYRYDYDTRGLSDYEINEMKKDPDYLKVFTTKSFLIKY